MRISDWSSDVCSSDLRARNLDLGEAPVFAEAVEPDDRHGDEEEKDDPKQGRQRHRRERPLVPFPVLSGHPPMPSGLDAWHCYMPRSEEHTSELQSLMRISYAVFCLKKKTKQTYNTYSKHKT